MVLRLFRKQETGVRFPLSAPSNQLYSIVSFCPSKNKKILVAFKARLSISMTLLVWFNYGRRSGLGLEKFANCFKSATCLSNAKHGLTTSKNKQLSAQPNYREERYPRSRTLGQGYRKFLNRPSQGTVHCGSFLGRRICGSFEDSKEYGRLDLVGA